MGLFLTLHTMASPAQENWDANPERGSVLPGFIITHDGDTVAGYLLNINLWMNQHMTFFYKTPDDKEGRVKYKPKEIMAYQVGNRFYESVKYPFSNSIFPQNFVMRKVDGPIKYYVWYYDEDRSKLMSPNITLDDLSRAFLFDEQDLWKEEFGKKGDGVFTKFDFRFLVKFAKNMAAYVNDDPELAQKILAKAKGYQNIDIEKIVREYNEYFQGK